MKLLDLCKITPYKGKSSQSNTTFLSDYQNTNKNALVQVYRMLRHSKTFRKRIGWTGPAAIDNITVCDFDTIDPTIILTFWCWLINYSEMMSGENGTSIVRQIIDVTEDTTDIQDIEYLPGHTIDDYVKVKYRRTTKKEDISRVDFEKHVMITYDKIIKLYIDPTTNKNNNSKIWLNKLGVNSVIVGNVSTLIELKKIAEYRNVVQTITAQVLLPEVDKHFLAAEIMELKKNIILTDTGIEKLKSGISEMKLLDEIEKARRKVNTIQKKFKS